MYDSWGDWICQITNLILHCHRWFPTLTSWLNQVSFVWSKGWVNSAAEPLWQRSKPFDQICETEFTWSKNVASMGKKTVIMGSWLQQSVQCNSCFCCLPSISSLPAGEKRSNLLQATSFLSAMQFWARLRELYSGIYGTFALLHCCKHAGSLAVDTPHALSSVHPSCSYRKSCMQNHGFWSARL